MACECDDWRNQINEELRLERERLQGIIDSINEEIAARRRQQQETNFEGNIEAAQRRVDVVAAKLAFERDADNRAQLEQELIRAQQALKREQERFDDWRWENDRRDEIADLRRELANAEQKARDQIEEAEAEADRRSQANSQQVSQQQQRIDPTIDFSAKMLASTSQAELEYWARLRDQKIAQEGIDLAANGWMTTQEVKSLWQSPDNIPAPSMPPAMSATALQQQAIIASAGAEMMEKTAAVAAQAAVQAVNTSQNAHMTVNNNGVPMSSGQLAAAMEQVLDHMARQ